MNGLYKEKGVRFFAASNTKDGFVSYFDKIFGEDECDRLYILKGGPGCGKSTFMKKLGKRAEDNGLHTVYFHCSSDPESLDGIIIKEKRIAVIDGTSPHAVEPMLSGAREIIIDLGRGWDTDKLYDNKAEIQRLSQIKKQCYKDCYSFLNSKSVMDGLTYNLVMPHVLFEKLEKSAAKFVKNSLKSKSLGTTKIRITEALSSLGKIRLFSFEDMAETCVFLKEPFSGCRLSHLYMSKIYEFAKNEGVKAFISFKADKKGEFNALYFPDAGVSVSMYDEKAVEKCDRSLKKCKIVNCARFLDTKALSHTKPLRKFYSKLSENMEKQALEALSMAGKTHMDIEKIYRLCTDYTTVEKISDEYINKILNY